MIALSINVTKINKSRIKDGKNGKYLDLVLFDNRGGKDQYGNDGFVSEGVTKEERQAGTRGTILGNWKHIGQAKPAAINQNTDTGSVSKAAADDDDIPF